MDKILFLTTVIPEECKDGGEIASRNIIEALIKCGKSIDLVGFERLGKKTDNTLSMNIRKYYLGVRFIESRSNLLNALAIYLYAFILGWPYVSMKFYSRRYVKIVKRLLEIENYERIYIDHAQIGWLLDLVPERVLKKVIYISHNVEYDVYSKMSLESKNIFLRYIYNRESMLVKKIEMQLVTKVKKVLVLSNNDKMKYIESNRDLSKKIQILPMYATIKTSECENIIYDLGLIGTWNWEINRKGLIWFLDRVLPHVDIKVSIAIAGKGAIDAFNGVECKDNVKLLGFVESSTDFMNSCGSICVPSTTGGGIQMKTLEALSSGRTVIGTKFAFRAIENENHGGIVTDCPLEMANEINRVSKLKCKNNPVGVEFINERICKFEALVAETY